MNRNEDPWRAVFNPGWNPNSRKAGNKIYDHVEEPKSAPTTWDYILQSTEKAQANSPSGSQRITPRSSSDLGSPTANAPTVMDVHELKSKLANADALLDMAKTNDGKVNFDRFCSMLRDQGSGSS